MEAAERLQAMRRAWLTLAILPWSMREPPRKDWALLSRALE